jgi:hypothetical protein
MYGFGDEQFLVCRMALDSIDNSTGKEIKTIKTVIGQILYIDRKENRGELGLLYSTATQKRGGGGGNYMNVIIIMKK